MTKRTPSLNIRLSRFLSLYAIGLAIVYKDARFMLMVANSVTFAMIVDSILVYATKKEWVLTDSSLITGLIVGFVLSSHQPWWVVSLASVFAICSKYLFTWGSRHIFNPAAFGILMVTIFFDGLMEWHGAFLWYIMIPGALYFVLKAKRFEIVMGYCLVYGVLFGVQAIWGSLSFLEIVRSLNYFFILIMLDDPLTSPHSPKGKIILGGAVATLVFILYSTKFQYDAYLSALLLGNLLVPLLNSRLFLGNGTASS